MIPSTKTAAIFALALLTLAAARPAAPETEQRLVELKGGLIIAGPVLKEGEDAVYIDLGFDVLRLPRPHVSRIGKAGERGAPGSAPAATGAALARSTVFESSSVRKMPSGPRTRTTAVTSIRSGVQ